MSETSPPDDVQPGSADRSAAARGPASTGRAEPAGAPEKTDTSMLRVALVIVGVAALAALAWTWSPETGRSPRTSPGTGTPLGNGDVGAGDAADEKQPPILIGVFAALDDRFDSEPCNRIPGGGLFSVRTVKDQMMRFLPSNLMVFMGDLSQAPGPVGAMTTQFHYTEVMPLTGIDIVAAGEGELTHGVEFVRDVLARPSGYAVLCANAVDAAGFPILRGWSLTSVGGRNVLTVAVAGESVGYELVRRGSDVRIASPQEAAAKALADGIARAIDVESPAHTRLLLVHGTLEEAEELLREVEGFDVAVAADGPVLPELEPRVIAGVPLYYAGRGCRFNWRVLIADGQPEPRGFLGRIGGGLRARGSPYGSRLAAIRSTMRHQIYERFADEDAREADPRGEYVGNAVCAGCHAEEATQHATSPHAEAPTGFLSSEYAGSTACLGCHVTAPYYRGGWAPSPAGTEEPGADVLRGADGVGCESCHGPGGEHAVAPLAGYGRVDYAACYSCHLPDRTPDLDAEASWSRSGHGALPK